MTADSGATREGTGPKTGGRVVYYHGTRMADAVSLLNGAALDAASAAALKWDGPPGFFLAAQEADAEFFAARRGVGAVLRYEFSRAAINRLLFVGADQRPIPFGSTSPAFLGEELYVPPAAFDAFNALRAAGEITITPAA